MSDTDDTGDTKSPPLRALARGFRKRTLVNARMMARLGMNMAKKNLGMSELASKVDEEAAVAAAHRLLAELDGLKGMATKLGQMVSYLDASLPPKAQRVLARLQFESRPMEADIIARVIETELGAPAAELFDHLEPEPFAAASIGQVHRARLGGADVAVKVQYPGIEDLLKKDLATIGRMSRMALTFSKLDGKALADELAGRVLDECNYLAEAENQEQFRRILADIEGLSIPGVIASHSSRRVITTEFDHGANFYEFRESASHEARSRAGRLIYQSCFTSIFGHAAYNADPHPGNYLFTPEGHVTLLDFGCVKRFDPDMIGRWKRVARAVIDNDLARFRDAFIDAGFVGRERKFDFEHQLEAMRALYQPMIATEPYTITAEWLSKVNDLMVFKNRNKFKLAMQPDWLFVNRLQFGMLSVLAHLGATARWSDYFRAALDSPLDPLPPLADPATDVSSDRATP